MTFVTLPELDDLLLAGFEMTPWNLWLCPVCAWNNNPACMATGKVTPAGENREWRHWFFESDKVYVRRREVVCAKCWEVKHCRPVITWMPCDNRSWCRKPRRKNVTTDEWVEPCSVSWCRSKA